MTTNPWNKTEQHTVPPSIKFLNSVQCRGVDSPLCRVVPPPGWGEGGRVGLEDACRADILIQVYRGWQTARTGRSHLTSINFF